MNNDEPTAEEIALREAAIAGKHEIKIKRFLTSFGGAVWQSPVENGRLALRVKDIFTSCEPIGEDECTPIGLLAAASILLAEAVQGADEVEKQGLAEMLHDLVLGDEKAQEQIVGIMVSGAFAPRSVLVYKVNVGERNE